MSNPLRQMEPVAQLVVCLLLASMVVAGCRLMAPGRMTKVPDYIPKVHSDTIFTLSGAGGKQISAQYLGCGGIYLLYNGSGLLIDPFFSNQRFGKLAVSVLTDKANVHANDDKVDFGLHAIERETGPLKGQVRALVSTHSHYDHLLDVPAIMERLEFEPVVYLTESGKNICCKTVCGPKVYLLEDFRISQETQKPPIRITLPDSSKIVVHPILAGHKAHLKNIKAFDGSVAVPLEQFTDPYGKTRANDWLEGACFSLLIDYVAPNDSIVLRVFVQGTSCNPPWGVPPEFLCSRPVDIAFLCVASYDESPAYPMALLNRIQPKLIFWIHWEDFFRDYRKKPKPMRTADIEGFFQKVKGKEYLEISHLPWPRTRMTVNF